MKKGHFFSEKSQQYEVFIPFSPLASLEEYHHQAYESVIFDGHHIPYIATLGKKSLEFFPANLPEGFLILAMGDKGYPNLICYYYTQN